VARRPSRRFVWSMVGKRAHDQFEGARNAPSGVHQTYIHRLRDNKITTYLSDIYHNGLQDDKRQVRINESPPARMSQNSAIAQEEDLRPGRRPTSCAALRMACLLGVILAST
jgi:hypothetical protein